MVQTKRKAGPMTKKSKPTRNSSTFATKAKTVARDMLAGAAVGAVVGAIKGAAQAVAPEMRRARGKAAGSRTRVSGAAKEQT